MDLDKQDMKVLSSLYHNNRESLQKIAKKSKLSRIQVEYRYKKFIDNKIIRGFFSLFDYKALGYNVYVFMFIKLQKFSSFDSFKKKLESSKNCISTGECFGKYDLYANLIFKDEEDMSNFLASLINDKTETIANYQIIKPFLAEYHPLKILNDNSKKILPLISNDNKKINLKKEDYKILKILAKNGRTKVIDIAKATGISAELALHKIRRFEREGVILGCRALLDMKKIGYDYSLILLNVNDFSSELKNKIINFSRTDKNINALILSLFNPNCMLQIFHNSSDELKEEIRKIKELLKDKSFDLEIVLAKEEDKINSLPFI